MHVMIVFSKNRFISSFGIGQLFENGYINVSSGLCLLPSPAPSPECPPLFLCFIQIKTNDQRRSRMVMGRLGPEVALYSCLVKPISIRRNEITLEVFKLEVAYDPRFAIMCLIYEHKFERCTFCFKAVRSAILLIYF